MSNIKAARDLAYCTTALIEPIRAELAGLLGTVADALDCTPPDVAAALEELQPEELARLSPTAAAVAVAIRDLLLPAPHAWADHTGAACPVARDALVAIDLGPEDSGPRFGPAAAWNWGAGAGPAGEGRIHRWARMAA